MVVVAETPNDDDDDDDDDDNEVAEASNPKLERRAGLYPEGAASGPDRSEGRQGDGTRSASQLVSGEQKYIRFGFFSSCSPAFLPFPTKMGGRKVLVAYSQKWVLERSGR